MPPTAFWECCRIRIAIRMVNSALDFGVFNSHPTYTCRCGHLRWTLGDGFESKFCGEVEVRLITVKGGAQGHATQSEPRRTPGCWLPPPLPRPSLPQGALRRGLRQPFRHREHRWGQRWQLQACRKRRHGSLGREGSASHSEETSLSPRRALCFRCLESVRAGDWALRLHRSLNPEPCCPPDGQLCTKTPVNPASSQRGVPGSEWTEES